MKNLTYSVSPSLDVQFEGGAGQSIQWSRILNKPFKTLGKGLQVVNGELQVSVVETIEDYSAISLDEQRELRDTPELETYLEKFEVGKFSTRVGDGNRTYHIHHNLNSDALILKVWGIGIDIPEYTATKKTKDLLQIDFAEPIEESRGLLQIYAVEYSAVDMVPWANVSNVKTASKEEILKILKGEN